MKRHLAGQKRVTVDEVARQAGISAMTVSRALNNHPNVSEKTRKKVLDVSRRLGYTPNQIAKSLVLRKTHTIGVVVPEITHSFFPEAIRGI
ncbi:MAG TPA: LacI family DNA-binding transcriptional regulator, partial [Bacteroidota bacterium]|nr:LacI family DNA-binding transcriptional regulator [Bacteroidota bacterium]